MISLKNIQTRLPITTSMIFTRNVTKEARENHVPNMVKLSMNKKIILS